MLPDFYQILEECMSSFLDKIICKYYPDDKPVDYYEINVANDFIKNKIID